MGVEIQKYNKGTYWISFLPIYNYSMQGWPAKRTTLDKLIWQKLLYIIFICVFLFYNFLQKGNINIKVKFLQPEDAVAPSFKHVS